MIPVMTDWCIFHVRQFLLLDKIIVIVIAFSYHFNNKIPPDILIHQVCPFCVLYLLDLIVSKYLRPYASYVITVYYLSYYILEIELIVSYH